MIIDQTVIPVPCEILGNFIVYLEKTGNISNNQRIRINSGLINIDLQDIQYSKTFILPIFNVFEIYELILGSEFYHIETFQILSLKNQNKIKVFEFSGYRLSIQRLNEAYDCFTHPPIQNYEESRAIKTGIKQNYNELKLSSFRLKRFLAAYYELTI